MSLECADGTFGYVAMMDIRGQYFVSGCPDVGDVLAVFLACFVIEDWVVDAVTASIVAVHDAGVGRDAVAVFPCLEGLDEDGVGVAVVGNHHVLVAAVGADGEVSCVVRGSNGRV